MADRYNNLNNTAPEVDPLKQKRPSIDKSDFDLGQALYFQALDGMIIPFWHLRVIPNSSIDLSITIRAIMTNPYVKQLVSGKRAYVHVYHSNLSDLWEGAPELLKKGRDFNTKLSIPTLRRAIKTSSNPEVNYTSVSAGSPACYLGIPVERYNVGTQQTPSNPLENIKPQLIGSSVYQINNLSNFAFSCLPLVMYQQIYQAHYLNKNLINNNTDWLPQVENHFILPLEASGQQIAKLSYDINEAKDNTPSSGETFDFNSELFVPRNVTTDNPQTNSNKPFLNVIRFRQFKGDMFTAGSPFPDLMRGDVPVMSFADLTGTIDWSSVIAQGTSPMMTGNFIGLGFGAQATPTDPTNIFAGSLDDTYHNTVQAESDATTRLMNTLNKAVVNVQNQLSFNLNALRALDVYTLLGERAARTDGTYNNYIKTMFNVDPRYHMHEPRYLGGFYLDFVNQTIEQTSESNTTALGTIASRGIANGNGYIGKFSFNDHGYLMAVLDIVDETIYTGGVDRDWTDLEFEDQYLPLFNGLAPQATRVQELFLTGVKATNEKPFNYVERYSHLKSRRNKALGQMSLPAYDVNNNPVSPETASYMHMRRFTSEPTFNNLWVTMTPKNIDMTPYSSTNDYPFLVTATTSVDAVLPLPYITVPSGLAIMA